MTDTSRSLSHDIIAITGATSGIGAATARRLVAAGARVALGARGQDRLNDLVDELGKENAVGVVCDVRIPSDCKDLIAAAVEAFGGVTGLVANAGIGAYGGISDHDDALLARMMETNFAGTVWAVRAAVPEMRLGGGDIVIVSSVAGMRGASNEAVYAGTKFAQLGLAGALDRELRSQGIRVSTVAPAGVATEFAMGLGRTPDMPGLRELLDPEDVAFAITTVLAQPRRLRTTLWALWSNAESS
jgi:3-oxoacyl-[acyl-carrier protein] reductase